MAALLACLWALSATNESAQTELHAVATDGRLYHHIQAAFSQSDDTAIAWATRVIIRENAVASAPPAVENSAAGYDALKAFLSQPDTRTGVVSHFVGLLRSADELTNVLTVMDTAPWATPFVLDCLKILTKRPDSQALFSPDIVLSRWKVLTHDVFIDDESQWASFLKSGVVPAGVATRIMESEFTPDDIPLYRSLRAVLSGQEASQFIAWCVAGLKSQTSPSWIAAMQESQPLLSLAFDLFDQALEWATEELASALERHAVHTITTTPSAASVKSTEWAQLVEALSSQRRDLLKRALLEAAVAAHGKFSGPFFDYYGPLISEQALLLREYNVVARLFYPLLTERNVPGLTWLAAVLSVSPNLLRDHTDQSGAKVFTDGLEAALVKPADEATPSIDSIAKTLGISPPPPPDEQDKNADPTPEEPEQQA